MYVREVGAEESTGISVLKALWNKEEKERIQRGSFGTLGWGVIIFSQATRRAAAVTHNPSAIPCFPAPSDFPQTSIRSTYAILFFFSSCSVSDTYTATWKYVD